LADLLLVNKKRSGQRFAGFCASLLRIKANFERCSNFPRVSRWYFQCSAIFTQPWKLIIGRISLSPGSGSMMQA